MSETLAGFDECLVVHSAAAVGHVASAGRSVPFLSGNLLRWVDRVFIRRYTSHVRFRFFPDIFSENHGFLPSLRTNISREKERATIKFRLPDRRWLDENQKEFVCERSRR
jgi:hypothetical protein